MSGKLIVFEGTDGSGKGTQFSFLLEYLQQKNIPHASLDFPQYGKTFFGDLAGQMLRGDFGGVADIPAQLAALPYACDRWSTKDDLIDWLAQGKTVVVNRYTGSSAVYQAAKLPEDKQAAFIEWVYTLEQTVIGLPKEDTVIYLHVPIALSQTLIQKKDDRAYLNGKKDIYEQSQQLQETVEKLYGVLAKQSHWKTIECAKESVMRPREEIAREVIDTLTAAGML